MERWLCTDKVRTTINLPWKFINAAIRIVGFDELGNTDSFQTAALELKLIHAGVIKKKEEKVDTTKKSIFQSNDYDSDLDDDWINTTSYHLSVKLNIKIGYC